MSDENRAAFHDVFELFWRERYYSLGVVAAALLLGFIYVFLSPEVWSSKAVVIEANAAETNQLRRRLEQLSIATANLGSVSGLGASSGSSAGPGSVSGLGSSAGTGFSVNVDFFNQFNEEKLYQNFIQAYDSFDNKDEFLKKMGYFPYDEIGDKISTREAVKKISGGIFVIKHKNEKWHTISFGASTAEGALLRMSKYLDFIGDKEVFRVNRQIDDKIDAIVGALELQYQRQKDDALMRLSEEIERTELALRVSKAAGVYSPVSNLNNQSLFPIDLGSRALEQKLKVLRGVKDPEILSPGLADTRAKVAIFKGLSSEHSKFKLYKFLQSPEEPIRRDSPRMLLVMINSIISGVIISLIFVYIKFWFSRTFVR